MGGNRSWVLFILITFGLFLPFLPTSENTPEDFERIRYKGILGDRLFLHYFSPAEANKLGPKKPAVICFFGGGWVKGHPKQFYRHCRQFARRGIPAFSAEYRVYREHGTSPYECMEDVVSAIGWLRRNSDRFGIDPNRIIACGASAGGHLAAYAALIAGWEPTDDRSGKDSRPDALILFNPILDTTETGYGSETFGADSRRVSPVHQVRKNAPPAIVFHGDADEIVSLENSRRFCERMESFESRCELIPYPDGKHGFFHEDKAFEKTFQLAMDFLKDVGLLENGIEISDSPRSISETKN